MCTIDSDDDLREALSVYDLKRVIVKLNSTKGFPPGSRMLTNIVNFGSTIQSISYQGDDSVDVI
jgi:hypothetical protein